MENSSSQVGSTPGLSINGAVATITLSRPDKLNRLTPDDLRVLLAHCAQLATQADVRAVVITSDTQGQKRPVFSAGYDVQGFDGGQHDPSLFERTVNAIEGLAPIVIGAINGSVYGGATDLVMACDLRIGLDGTEFRMPACALGLHYYPGGLRRFVAVLGLQGAREMFLTAAALPVTKLQAWGAFVSVQEADGFTAGVQELVTRVAALAPLSARLTKQSLRELGRGMFDEAALYQREAQCAGSEDFAEGRRAFQERRAPLFRGR